MDSKWIGVNDRLPEEGQHVLVWDDRMNIYPFPHGHPGDDGEGRYRMGDAIFRRIMHHKLLDVWKGQGPCEFYNVTHWMPLPERPEEQ